MYPCAACVSDSSDAFARLPTGCDVGVWRERKEGGLVAARVNVSSSAAAGGDAGLLRPQQSPHLAPGLVRRVPFSPFYVLCHSRRQFLEMQGNEMGAAFFYLIIGRQPIRLQH